MRAKDAAEHVYNLPPVDFSRLLTLGQDITSDATPAVPALCARLGRYAAIVHKSTQPSNLMEWSIECYQNWMERLARDEPTAVQATIETDPANLILGAKALPDLELATRCIRAQLDLYHRHGTALPRLNQTTVLAILDEDDPKPESSVIARPLAPIELARSTSPMALAALALSVRNSQDELDTLVTEEDVEAVVLCSVWSRDLSGLGLSLLASKLLFGRMMPGSVKSWITRIARSDGLLGMWQLYDDSYPVANLLGTANVYWALSAPTMHGAGDVHRSARKRHTSEITSRQCASGITGGLAWLEAREERFQLLPACQDETQFESRFKPLVEVSLLCYVLTRRRFLAMHAPWAGWAEAMARRLFRHMEWEGLIEAFRLQTSATLGLAIYPLLTSASGQTTAFATEVRALVEDSFAQAQERTPMREMDYQFTRKLVGASVSDDDIRSCMTNTILRRQFDPLLMDTDALYDLTHVAFYATQFGCVPWVPPSNVAGEWMAGWLNRMTLARFLMGDADLGSELLLVGFYTGHPIGPTTLCCLDYLLASQASTGAFHGPMDVSEDLDEFDACYHTTLVAVAALAEAVLLRGRWLAR